MRRRPQWGSLAEAVGPVDHGEQRGMTAPDGSVTCTVYAGNQTVVKDPAGKWRSSFTDGLGRLTKVIESPTANNSCGTNNSPLNWETVYGYDVQDRLTSVDQGDRDRSFAYDTLGRLTSASNPESGTITYSYDPAGNVVSRSDGRFSTSMVYDAGSRIQSKSYTDPQTPAVTYCYDGESSGSCAGAPSGGASQNQLGRLTMVSNGVSSTKYSAYDVLGRVLASSQMVGGQTYPPFSYQYNNLALTQRAVGGDVINICTTYLSLRRPLGQSRQACRLTGHSFLIFRPAPLSGVVDRRPAGVDQDAEGGERFCGRRAGVGTFPEGGV